MLEELEEFEEDDIEEWFEDHLSEVRKELENGRELMPVVVVENSDTGKSEYVDLDSAPDKGHWRPMVVEAVQRIGADRLVHSSSAWVSKRRKDGEWDGTMPRDDPARLHIAMVSVMDTGGISKMFIANYDLQADGTVVNLQPFKKMPDEMDLQSRFDGVFD